MDDYFLNTLQKCCRELTERQKNEDPTLITEKLLNDALAILHLCRIGRREGLLALTEAADALGEDLTDVEELRELVEYIVMGIDPNDFFEIALSRMITRDLQDEQLLAYLIYLEGTCAIQCGESYEILEIRMKNLLPSFLEQRFLECIEKERSEYQKTIAEACEVGELWKKDERGYDTGILVDRLLFNLGDRAIQRLLRDIELAPTLAAAFQMMSGKARVCILANLSDRLAKQFYEDVLKYENASKDDIIKADEEILLTLLRLIGQEEIESTYLWPFNV